MAPAGSQRLSPVQGPSVPPILLQNVSGATKFTARGLCGPQMSGWLRNAATEIQDLIKAFRSAELSEQSPVPINRFIARSEKLRPFPASTCLAGFAENGPEQVFIPKVSRVCCRRAKESAMAPEDYRAGTDTGSLDCSAEESDESD